MVFICDDICGVLCLMFQIYVVFHFPHFSCAESDMHLQLFRYKCCEVASKKQRVAVVVVDVVVPQP